MSSNYYLGTSPAELLGGTPRFWYALRRNDDGELFFYRSDQLTDKSSIELNKPGSPQDNFDDFETGTDYFNGIAEDHEIEYLNLIWTQYRWDDRNILYYVEPNEGRLVQRINQGYSYPEGTSSNG
jgi:hypothetical protein